MINERAPATEADRPEVAARDRYARIGEEWNRRFSIRTIYPITSLNGKAWPGSRDIQGPWPTTTRNRLYIWAHEVGHVALEHTSPSIPVYVREYEAERFAVALMREAGLHVPLTMIERGKCYVRSKIVKALRRGLRQIDPKIAAWAGVKFYCGHSIVVRRESVVFGTKLRTCNRDYFAEAQERINLSLVGSAGNVGAGYGDRVDGVG